MDVLLRWPCRCTDSKSCQVCNGKGYSERWIPTHKLREIKKDYIICGCRNLKPV
jgi:hypothetical protein